MIFPPFLQIVTPGQTPFETVDPNVLVNGRLGRLGERARELCGFAAVIGRELGLDVLGAVSGLPDDVFHVSRRDAPRR